MRIPKYLQERFGKLEQEDGLIDDCKYMLYFAEGWGYYMGYKDYTIDLPVRNYKEVIKFLKEAMRVEDIMKL